MVTCGRVELTGALEGVLPSATKRCNWQREVFKASSLNNGSRKAEARGQARRHGESAGVHYSRGSRHIQALLEKVA